MTDEQRFKEHFPKATIEMRKSNGGKRYYLVREHRRAFMWTGCGDTRKEAWADAAKRLPKKED